MLALQLALWTSSARADTGAPDTGIAAETGDTGAISDTGPPADTDTDTDTDTDPPADTASDSGMILAPTGAASLAGEPGGVGCAHAHGTWIGLLGALTLLRRGRS